MSFYLPNLHVFWIRNFLIIDVLLDFTCISYFEIITQKCLIILVFFWIWPSSCRHLNFSRKLMLYGLLINFHSNINFRMKSKWKQIILIWLIWINLPLCLKKILWDIAWKMTWDTLVFWSRLLIDCILY